MGVRPFIIGLLVGAVMGVISLGLIYATGLS
jgi:hypothetical protein